MCETADRLRKSLERDGNKKLNSISGRWGIHLLIEYCDEHQYAVNGHLTKPLLACIGNVLLMTRHLEGSRQVMV